MGQPQVEERGRLRGVEVQSSAFQVHQQRLLLGLGTVGEGMAAAQARRGVQRRQPQAIRLPQLRAGAGQGSVDGVGHAGLRRLGAEAGGREQAGGDRVNRSRLLAIEAEQRVA